MLEKLIERVFGNPIERRYAQNMRIMTEFTWLWAVQNCWELSTDYIGVTDSEEFRLSGKIRDDINNGSKKRFGLWLHSMHSINGRPMESVEQIWKGSHHDLAWIHGSTTWSDLIRNKAKPRAILLHLAARNTDDADQVLLNTVIVRPQKPFKSFNGLWQGGNFRFTRRIIIEPRPLHRGFFLSIISFDKKKPFGILMASRGKGTSSCFVLKRCLFICELDLIPKIRDKIDRTLRRLLQKS